MNFNNSNENSKKVDKKKLYFAKYQISRPQLLLIVAFTVVNLVMLLIKSDTYFLFSASIPYVLVSLGMTLCGMLPEEYYDGGYAAYDFYGKSFFYLMLAVAVVTIAVYLVCFFMSKKHGAGWLIVSLVLFVADTVTMVAFYGFDRSMILDLLFHLGFIAYMIYGIVYYFKWKKEPDAAAPQGSVLNGDFRSVSDADAEENGEEYDADYTSPVLRVVDPDVKARILCKADFEGHTVEYRRVKRTNELVIDGHVYDEVEMLMETPHTLSARVFGHTFTAGIGIDSHSEISVDGDVIARKLRLI